MIKSGKRVQFMEIRNLKVPCKRMGRQKIEIKKIEKKSALEVAFSKRRTGVFKKAGQLCVLCGCEAAVIVFSPAGKAFVFGHPAADAVLRQFLHRDGDITETDTNTDPNSNGREKVLGPEIEEEEGGFSWDAPLGNMGLNELEMMKRSIEELREKVADRVEEMAMMMVSAEGKNGTADHPSSSALVVEDVTPQPPPPPPQEYSSPPVVDAGAGLAAAYQNHDDGLEQGFHINPLSPFSDDRFLPKYHYCHSFHEHGRHTTSYSSSYTF